MNFRPSFFKKVRFAIAFALALWCAGTGCMLVSYAHGAAMRDEAGADQLGNHTFAGMSGAAEHDCCKARYSSKRGAPAKASHHFSSGANDLEHVALPESPTSSGSMSCCPLTSGSFVVSQSTRAGEQNQDVSTHGNALLLSFEESNVAPLSVPLRLPNQNQTYLHCCVFLI